VATLSIPFTVAALLKEITTDNDAVVECALVFVARLASLRLNFTSGLNHTR